MTLEPMQHLTAEQQAGIDRANALVRNKAQPVSKATALASLEILISNYSITPLNEHWVNIQKRIRGE